MQFFIEKPWFIFLIVAIIGGIVLLVHHSILKVLEKRDFRKKYSEEKLRKKIRKREDKGKFYYGINYYVWQKNKLETLYSMFPVGEYFTDKYITTDTASYSVLTYKFWSHGKRIAFYKKEFRVYYKIADIRKSVVNNFNHNGIGSQNNNVYQNENNVSLIINQLENFLNEVDVQSNDEVYIENFIDKLSKGNISDNDKNRIIEVLSKYTSVGSNIISIITGIAKFFGM
ncbi:hypothetical protein [Enterococcus hirae]|uniref:hypothetical protein n=1 Tax=Enterococcus hirae TaxID=1354 RepID=UPI0039A72915